MLAREDGEEFPLLPGDRLEAVKPAHLEALVEARAQPTGSKLRSLWAPALYAVVSLALVVALFHANLAELFYNGRAERTLNFAEMPRRALETHPLDAPKGWKWRRALDEAETVTLTLAVKQSNVDQMDDKLMAVSDPKSPTYGQHLSFDEVHDFFAPEQESLDVVVSWLEYVGVDPDDIARVTPNGDFLRVQVPVKVANAMLGCDYGVWEHEQRKVTHTRVQSTYSVPEAVAEHLDFISPTVRFPVKRHTKTFTQVPGGAVEALSSDYVTPSSLADLYHYDVYTASGAGVVSQAVASFIQEWFVQDDVDQFWSFFGLPSTEVVKVPENQPDGYGSEAELDVQYLTTTGNGIKTIVWDIEDDNYFISLLQQIADSDILPNVVSMSYGGDEQENGIEYCGRANVEFAKVGLLGITFFASSGDDGSCGSSGSCGANDEYLPSFPASSPYVTAVGGTYGGAATAIGSDVSTDEVAWYNSGGGFSTFFPMPSWQQSAVQQYLSTATSLPDSAKYVATGRAYPDISAQSVYYVICMANAYWLVSGTSASCPTVAGMFSLINDARMSSGKSALGFLNPLLYQLYDEDQNEYFNDVTSGDNEGCDGGVAWTAQAGWDPVTGVGTPKFDKLLAKLKDIDTVSYPTDV